MQEHIENIARTVSTITYSVSGGLVISDWISILDQHAAAIGVCIGILTYMTNLAFQLMNHRIIRATGGERRK